MGKPYYVKIGNSYKKITSSLIKDNGTYIYEASKDAGEVKKGFIVVAKKVGNTFKGCAWWGDFNSKFGIKVSGNKWVKDNTQSC